MKRLTYQNQIYLGIIGLGVGHLLSWLTDVGFFVNLGWIFYGTLFVFHPVWPKRADTNPHIKKYVQITGAVIILLGLMLRTGAGDQFWHDRIAESLGVDVSEGAIQETFDDHSGFHGDGTMYAAFEFEDERFEKIISAPGGWNALPLPDNLQTLLYGKWSETEVVGPFIGVTFPRAENGFWYFYDRQGQTQDYSEVLNRSSFNYTFAVYDADQDCLYYCEFDT